LLASEALPAKYLSEREMFEHEIVKEK
jgi:hypothetical protein